MATFLNISQMETKLIMDHHQQVRLLEMEYTNYICELLKQKNMILYNLQQQFIEQRNKIKQTFENQHINKALDDSNVSTSNYAKIKVNVTMQRPIENNDTLTAANVKLTTKNIEGKVHRLENKQNESSKSTQKHKLHKCPRCEYSTPYATSLKRHIRTHTKEKPFECEHCKMRFSHKCSMKKHIEKVHGLEYKSSDNTKGTKSSTKRKSKEPKQKSAKKSKQKSPSTSIKAYKCPNCGYSTNNFSHLKVHIRTHTGERPFVCTYPGCNKRFSQKGNLRGHMKRHSMR